MNPLLVLALIPQAHAVSGSTLQDLGPYTDGRVYFLGPHGRLESRSFQATDRARQAFRYEDPVRDLHPQDVNESRQFVGFGSVRCDEGHHRDCGRTTAFLWDSSGFLEISAPDGRETRAHAINELGQVVGSTRSPSGERTAFLWDRDIFQDLNELAQAPGWWLCEAFDIDDEGVIVGYGVFEDEFRLFALVPPGESGTEAMLGPPSGGGFSTSAILFPPSLPQSPVPLTTLAVDAVFLNPDLTLLVDCDAWGFEDGAFTPWQCRRGSYGSGGSPISCVLSPNTLTTAGSDFTVPSIPTVSPRGGTYAIRLGDNVNGAHMDAIERTFTVAAPDTQLHYEYALVLQDPGHAPSDQPYFKTRVWVGSNPVPVYEFKKVSSSSDPFFFTPSPGIVARNWSCDEIDLSAYQGQTATIRIEVADCNLGAHWGYAYVDFPCNPGSVQLAGPSSRCVGEPTTFTSSQSGVIRYRWSVRSHPAFSAVDDTVTTPWTYGAPGPFDAVDTYALGHGSTPCGRVYRVTLEVETECGTFHSSRLLRYGCVPVVDVGPDVCVCPGGVVVLSVASPQTGVAYSWWEGGTQIGTGTTIAVTPGATTNYIVQAAGFSTPPFFSCSSQDEVTISVQDADLHVEQSISCNQRVLTAVLTGSTCSASQVQWSTGATGPAITVPVSQGGTYSATVTTDCGQLSDSISLSAVPAPTFVAPTAFNRNSGPFKIFHVGLLDGEEPAYLTRFWRFEVIDRWGGIIVILTGHGSGSYPNGSIPGWDGRATQNSSHRRFLWGSPSIQTGDYLENGVYLYRFYVQDCQTGQLRRVQVNGTELPTLTYLH